MKQIITLKNLLIASCIAGAFVANDAKAQTVHPLAFAASAAPNNFYKDYVGTRVQVTQPASSPVAHDYVYTTSYNTGTTSWGTAVTIPIIDSQVIMGTGAPGSDSFACTTFTTPGYMTGKIALIWRGPLASPCEFGLKALNCQSAGAIAVVIINEYDGEGPVGMAAGASGAGVLIPVFMISNVEGKALAALYRASAPGTVKMSITPWGKNLAHDLGFVPGGVSTWHNYATPAYEMSGTPTATAYKGIDGAFIANYGTATMNNVKLVSSLTFQAIEATSPTVIHTNTVTMTPTAFPAPDSIYALFGAPYDLTGISGSGKGTFTNTYTITSTETDDAPGDNTFTDVYYTTDSVFSKGEYDFNQDRPKATFWTRPGGTVTDYLWGVPYYVAHGGPAIRNIGFSVSGASPGLIPVGTGFTFYVFKWHDGTVGAGSLDSAIEGGELELVGAAQKNDFNGTSDSTFGYFNTTDVRDDTTGNGGGQLVALSDTTWYFICAEMNTSFGLGCDGIRTQYPRSFGLTHFNNITELYNPLFATSTSGPMKDQMRTLPTTPFFSYFGGGGFAGNAFDVDSLIYHDQIGLVPALSFKITPWHFNGVKEVAPTATKFEVFPNPASNEVNVAIELVNSAKTVSYTVLSSLGQVVSKETRNNVQNDKYTYSAKNLAPGNYYMVVNADGKIMNKKFTIIK